jgi:hypothetical protein
MAEPIRFPPGSYAAILQAVNLPRSGTDEAQAALEDERRRAVEAGSTFQAFNSVLARMVRTGLICYDRDGLKDGEPPAISVEGIEYLNDKIEERVEQARKVARKIEGAA